MQLPPLLALRFFEATARHLSVKLAAEELCVTPGAASQQLRKLEEYLGCPLFERLPRGLALTTAGREYQTACQEALALIGHATAKLTRTQRHTIVVSCTPSFATQWLVPKLLGFMQTSPEIDVHVSTTNRLVDLNHEGVDFAIRHGLGRYPGLKVETLVQDDLIPVCSPQLIAPRKSAKLSDITAQRLLHDEHRDDWRLWFEAQGISNVDCNAGVVFTDSNAAIEAALAGLGYALVRRALVASEIASGRLLCVKAPALRTPLAYHLVYRAETLIDSALRSFRDWIMAQ
jgi:LysR family glycine cleavage system transcriptional activator